MTLLQGAIAQKIGMSRMVDEYGQMVAVTLLEMVDQKVTKVLTTKKHGYSAYQVGYFPKNAKHLRRPDHYRLRKSGIKQHYSKFKEFRCLDAAVHGDNVQPLDVGQAIGTENFKNISHVDVSGITKGRGFQGSIKRWKFRIAPMSHGSRYHRRTGSLGNCTTPGRVMPGKKLPGQYGNHRRTLAGLKLMVCDDQQSILAVKGAVPGNRGSFVEVRVSRLHSDKQAV